jgi:hypothetical protein
LCGARGFRSLLDLPHLPQKLDRGTLATWRELAEHPQKPALLPRKPRRRRIEHLVGDPQEIVNRGVHPPIEVLIQPALAATDAAGQGQLIDAVLLLLEQVLEIRAEGAIYGVLLIHARIVTAPSASWAVFIHQNILCET